MKMGQDFLDMQFTVRSYREKSLLEKVFKMFKLYIAWTAKSLDIE